MIIEIDARTQIDTARDLSAEERHVVQKLFAWKTLVTSLEAFRQKKAAALAAGWNNSGPVMESRNMALICRHLEKELQDRLQHKSPH